MSGTVCTRRNKQVTSYLRLFRRRSCFVSALVLIGGTAKAAAQEPATVFQATLGEAGQPTSEVSTEELRRILADGSATVFDVRPFREFAISHIPGALNVAPKPDVPMSMYVSDVAEIGRTVGEDMDAPIVLYCNGPFCGETKTDFRGNASRGQTNGAEAGSQIFRRRRRQHIDCLSAAGYDRQENGKE